MMTRLIIVSLSIIYSAAYTQVDLQQVTDAAIGVPDEDILYEDQMENLGLLMASRIDVNKATADQLRLLNILSESQLDALLMHRREQGNLLSIYELQAIPGFDMTTIRQLREVVMVQDPNEILSAAAIRQQVSEGNHYLLFRYEIPVEKKQGFNDDVASTSRFVGSSAKNYFRFRSSKPGSYSVGITAENDSGEKFRWSPSAHQFGYDFLSIHARIENKGLVKNMILGDYTAQFGQGLALGGGFGYGKGSEAVLAARKCNLGFVPYSSSNEGAFFRGTAMTLQLSTSISLSVAYSSLYQDAKIQPDTLESTSSSTISTSGLHRNYNELRSKDTNRESNQVFNIDFSNNHLNVGVVAHRTSFSEEIIRKYQIYNQYAFRGNENLNVGLYFNYTRNNILFFGEGTKTVGAGSGYMIGMMLSLSSRIDLAFLRRSYQRNFITFYSNAFCESATPQNESGFYWGWKYRLNRKITASGYVDLFRSPWLRFRSYSPSEGYEWLVSASYQPSKSAVMRVQYREESKQRNQSTDGATHLTSAGTKRNYLVSFGINAEKKIKFNTRFQGSTYTLSGRMTHGMAIFQDIGLDLGKFGISIRHALFQTDDYDNRQYAYERDVWLAFTIPAVSGVGVRNYFLIQYDLNKVFSVWVKYTRLRYANQDSIGSGLDAINSDSKNDLKLQLRIRL